MESGSSLVRFCVNKRRKTLVKSDISERCHYCRYDFSFYNYYKELYNAEYEVEHQFICPYRKRNSRLKYVYDIIFQLYNKVEKNKLFTSFYLFIEINYYIPLNRKLRKKIIKISNLKQSFFKEGTKYLKDFVILKKYKILTKYDTIYYNVKLYPNVFNYICNRSYE